MPPAAVRLREALSPRPRRRVVSRKVEVKEERMAQAEAVDISRLVDERGITRFNIGRPIFEFFIVLINGYDIAAP
jgi:hypothetical protein